jgi:cytoskeletal protein CcmA (bactofilin family)
MKFGRRDNLFNSPPPDDGLDTGADSIRALPAPAASAAAPAVRIHSTRPSAPSQELNAFLGKGCIYEGKLTFEGRVRIDGKFTGEIFSNDTLEVGPDAEMEAEIDVAVVVIAGTVHGNITARGRCDLRAPAVVVGNITSPIVTMEEGVRFDGEMRMTTAIDEAVRAATRRAPGLGTKDTVGIGANATGTTGSNPSVADAAGSTTTGPTMSALAAPKLDVGTAGNGGARRSAPASRDPSELLKPVP